MEVLLVKKPHSLNWGIPKGNLERNLSPRENAAKEAFEEAGVKGDIRPEALGSYRAMKRGGDREILIEVEVYLLKVMESAKDWPEKEVRLVKWCSTQEAAILVREPLLADLYQKLGANQLAA